MRTFGVFALLACWGLSAQAQQKAPAQVWHNISKKEANQVFKQKFAPYQWEQLTHGSPTANKRSSFLLDSIETYTFNNPNDSLISGIRYFDYTAQDRLENDEAFNINQNGNFEGDERTTYEYGPGLYAEMTHFWDQFKQDWEYDKRIELQGDLYGGDTLFSRLEYNWNSLTNKWDGFEGQGVLDADVTGGSYELFFTFVYDVPNADWEFDTYDSTFTDALGNVTHELSMTWDNTNNRWELDEEVRSTFSQRPNNRKRVREEWDEDSSKYLFADSFVFKYVQDTILESGYYFGLNDSDVVDTLSYLTSNVDLVEGEVVQTYYRRDTTGTGFESYLRRTFFINTMNNEVTGYEIMDLEFDEGIEKVEFQNVGTQETIIEYEWSDADEKWVLSEKQEYDYNSEGFLTLNSFYSYDENNSRWEGIEKRTYIFASDDETVLNRTEYEWSNSTNDWVLSEKADFTYDQDNDPLLIVRSVYENNAWVLDEKDFFYYGSWMVNTVKYEVEWMQVYPNPVHDLLWFKTGLETVWVFDHSGRLVHEENNVTSLDVSHLPAGAYQVRAVIGEQPIAARFIKY